MVVIEKEQIVTLTYEMYVVKAERPTDGEAERPEVLVEKMTEEHPLTYCHGEKMMLPAVEAALEGKAEGEEFDCRFELTYPEAVVEVHLKGKILAIRPASKEELEIIRQPSPCGHHCGGHCEGECEHHCEGGCENKKGKEHGKHCGNCRKA